MKNFFFPLFIVLLFCSAIVTAQPRYHAQAEVILANITPEQARTQARQQALSEIIAIGTGVKIQHHLVLINSSVWSSALIQTSNARVIDVRCTYWVRKNSSRTLIQIADCSGAVQKFGQHAPQISTVLIPAKKGTCHIKRTDFQSQKTEIVPTFRAYEPFCLGIRASEKSWLGVFGLYETQGQVKISRIFPKTQTAIIVAAGEIPQLTPLASAPLPGQRHTLEALLVIASNRATLMDELAENTAGHSVAQTMARSMNIEDFDQITSNLDLDRITMRFIPYRVLAK